jgi:outer membrane protein
MISRFVLGLVLIALATPAAADTADSTAVQPPREQQWGLGMAVRSSNIVFDTSARSVATLVPLIMFENRYVFFREIEGGVHLLKRPHWELNFLGRVNWFDIPFDYQNQVQGDQLLMGGQVVWSFDGRWSLAADLLTDFDSNPVSNVLARYDYRYRTGQLRAFFGAKIKSSNFNSTYFGLDRTDVDGGVEIGGGIKITQNVWRNFYVTGAAALTRLDQPVRDTVIEFPDDRLTVDDDWKYEVYGGIGLSDPIDPPRSVRLPSNGYVRVAHCWATPSSLAKIFRGEAKKDPDNHQLTTVFYGHPLTDRVFGLPIEFFLHSGAGIHWPSDKQNAELELILSIKMLYTIPLPWRVRLGAAEGVSWVTHVPYREEENLSAKGYQTSQYLNYLDFSAELNLGDITPGKALDRLWLGYYIHHRSAIYKTAQQFGRIRGGSNFQSVSLTWNF